MGDVIDASRFKEALEKKRDPKAYEARKAYEALQRQHEKQLSLPKPVEMIEPEWDEEAGCAVTTYHLNRDPGDEL